MGTADRRLEIIKQLCCVRHTTMAALADEFHVSIRTIQRDIDAISGELGIPIYTKQGKYYGGIYILDTYTITQLYMRTEEVELLIKIREMLFKHLSENEILILNNMISTYSRS